MSLPQHLKKTFDYVSIWGKPAEGVPEELTGYHGFKNFLFLAWKRIGLPKPTPVQYDIAEFMQHGGEECSDRIAIQAFRGVGKSYIASAFCVWLLLLWPHLRIQVISGSKIRADDFSTFTLRLIDAMGELTEHLMPGEGQRNSKIAFDVGPAPVQHAPSVTSKGLFSQLTGGRADVIIPDDVVTKQNSATQLMRDKIISAVGEFNAILTPSGRIIYLMTPQSENDLAHVLPDLGYATRIWPAEIPPPKVVQSQGDRLAPMIRKMIDDGTPVRTPTDPLRFNEEDLEKRRIGYGRTDYALQFLLDQSLADAERFPLKLNDLIVDDLNNEYCYEKLVWTQSRENRIDELLSAGLNGDFYHRPMNRVGKMVKYKGCAMSIDPSGRGKDETAYSVGAFYAGQIFVIENGGIQGGYDAAVLLKLALVAKRCNVKKIIIEENFGQGMFEALLKPVLAKIYPCSIETVHHHVQKEHRICDVLEPVMNSHRLIFDRKVLERDWESAKVYPPEEQKGYTLSYQISHITRERGALRHDDRLDALAMMVQYWVDYMSQDVDKKMGDRRDEQQAAQVERFLRNAVGGPPAPKPEVWAGVRPGLQTGGFVR